MTLFTIVVSIFVVAKIVFVNSYTPIVIWHGLGGHCCATMGELSIFLKHYLPGVQVVSLRIGPTITDDSINSMVMHPDEQIKIALQIIQADPLLSNGFNAIGMSQGSQLLRGLIQRHPEVKVKTLITMTGQHQGVFGLPFCDPHKSFVCKIIRTSLNRIAYLKELQTNLTPSTYWHNPLDEQTYKQKSTFLADINNERYVNETYKSRLQSLEKFVMVKYLNDGAVFPKESAWFGFYKPGQAKEVQDLQSSDLYVQDRLGLKQMEKDGKLYFLENDWSHLEFKFDWFRKNIVDVFLK